jgi:hypothetical protein
LPAPPPSTVPPPVVPVPEPVKPPPRPDEVFSGHPVPATPEEQAREHAWFDEGRSFVGKMFFKPVVELDRFFSDETDLDPERAHSFARLRGGLKIRQDGRPVLSGDLLAQFYMPGVESWLNRFKLVLAGVSENSEDNLTNDTGTTTQLTGRQDPTNLELRFGAFPGIRSSVDLGVGILFHVPPGAFTRVRYRLAIPIDDVLVSRTSYQVFWRTDMLLGTRLTSALDWPVTLSSTVHLGGTAQVAQRKTDGLEYGAELVYSRAFTPTAAVALGTDATGDTRSPVAFEKYRIYARFRHDVLRRWLFVEAEPEVGWPWTPQRGRYQALAVTFRLEVQFEGSRAVETP